jgi:hypothetical protein
LSLRHTALIAGLLVASAGLAQAANPKLDAAIGAFNAVAGDASKLKSYCDMTKAMASSETAPSGDTQTADKTIEASIAALGPDFKSAMDLESEIDPASADGKTYSDALDVLDAKCGQ